MKKIAILQPTYLPYPGYFQIMSLVDEFYYLTNVDLNVPSFQHRNRIRVPAPALSSRTFECHKCGGAAVEKVDAAHPLYTVKVCPGCGNSFGKTPHGWGWLDVPVVHAHHGTTERLIQNTLIDNGLPWVQAHLAAIGSFYKRSTYYEELYPELEAIYMRYHERLWQLNLELIEWFRHHFEIRTPVFLEGEVAYDVVKDKTQRLVNFCIEVGADCYLEPEGGSAFMDPKAFDLNGIELRYFHYDPPEYLQLHEGFVPYMSALDLLLCLGPRAKNKLKCEWYDTQIWENVTPDFLPGGVVMGGKRDD